MPGKTYLHTRILFWWAHQWLVGSCICSGDRVCGWCLFGPALSLFQFIVRWLWPSSGTPIERGRTDGELDKHGRSTNTITITNNVHWMDSQTVCAVMYNSIAKVRKRGWYKGAGVDNLTRTTTSTRMELSGKSHSPRLFCSFVFAVTAR